MAVDPPANDFLIPPGLGVAGLTPGGLVVIARNLVMPWADLDAQSVPEDYLVLHPELLATVSSLVGMGPIGPRLLKTDALARLLTVASPNAVDTAQAAALINTNNVKVGNASAFAPGSWVMILAAAGNVNPGPSQFYQVVNQKAGNVLVIAPNLTAAVSAGDLVVGVPMIWIAGQTLNVSVPAGVGVIGNVPVLNATGTQISVNAPQKFLGTFAANAVGTFAVDAGAHALAVIGIPLGNALTVTGVTSGQNYNPNSAAGPIAIVPISSVNDSSYNLTTTVVAATTLRVSEVLDTEVVYVTQRMGETWNMRFDPTLNPQLWQAPNFSPAFINASIAVNAAVTVIAGVGGKVVFLFTVALKADQTTNNWWDLQDTAGTPVKFMDEATFQQKGFVDFAGCKLVTVGSGIALFNIGSSAGAINLRGTIVYSQG